MTTAIDTSEEIGIRWLLVRQGVRPSLVNRAIVITMDRDRRGRKRYERMHRADGPLPVVSGRCPLTSTPVESRPQVTDRDNTSERAAALLAALEGAGLSALVPHLRDGLTLCQSIRAAGLVESTTFRAIEAIRKSLSDC